MEIIRTQDDFNTGQEIVVVVVVVINVATASQRIIGNGLGVIAKRGPETCLVI